MRVQIRTHELNLFRVDRPGGMLEQQDAVIRSVVERIRRFRGDGLFVS